MVVAPHGPTRPLGQASRMHARSCTTHPEGTTSTRDATQPETQKGLVGHEQGDGEPELARWENEGGFVREQGPIRP